VNDTPPLVGRLEVEVGAPRELARRFVDRLAAAAAATDRRHAVVAVAGGSAAEAFLPAVAASGFDASRLELFWLDERAVPSDDSTSNQRLARALWLDRAAHPPSGFHPLRGDAPDLDAEARRAEAELVTALGDPPRIDLALAGVGEDGHVASLFPGRPELEERVRWIVAVDGAPKPPPRRLTMTLRAFAAVDLLVIGAFGAGKAPAIRAALAGREPASPLLLALRAARRALLLLDPPAAP